MTMLGGFENLINGVLGSNFCNKKSEIAKNYPIKGFKIFNQRIS
jgi:hypothetical protein